METVTISNIEDTRVKISIGEKLFEITLAKNEGLKINKVDFAESSQLAIRVNVSNEIEIT